LIVSYIDARTARSSSSSMICLNGLQMPVATRAASHWSHMKWSHFGQKPRDRVRPGLSTTIR
jgi:hypothetical protein